MNINDIRYSTHYIDEKGEIFHITGIAEHITTKERFVIVGGPYRGGITDYVIPESDLLHRKWRPATETEVYGPGGAAEYYKEYGGS